jgi:hypothetical protein
VTGEQLYEYHREFFACAPYWEDLPAPKKKYFEFLAERIIDATHSNLVQTEENIILLYK